MRGGFPAIELDLFHTYVKQSKHLFIFVYTN